MPEATPGRFDRVKPSEFQQGNIDDVRHIFVEAERELIRRIPKGRYASIVMTKLEEACMFATKAITHEGT